MAISKITSDAIDATGFNLDSNTLTVDATNNRVGIGRSSPANKLDILSSGSTVARFKRDNSGGASGGISVGNNDKLFTFFVDNSGGLQFYEDSTERIRFQLGGGISFNGDTATANALDDYEEGTFTPSNAYVTITVDSAAYVKVGNIVIYRFDISFPSNTNTNLAILTGFPFNSPQYNGGFTHWTTYGAPPTIHLSGTSTYVQNPASASSTLQLQQLSGHRIICNAVVSMT